MKMSPWISIKKSKSTSLLATSFTRAAFSTESNRRNRQPEIDVFDERLKNGKRQQSTINQEFKTIKPHVSC